MPGKHRKPKDPIKLAPTVAAVALSAAAAGTVTAPPAAADTTIVPVPQTAGEEISSPVTPVAGVPEVIPASTTYTVVPGDCVSVIAERVGVETEALYQTNRDVIGDDIDLIFPGQVLNTGAPAPTTSIPVPTTGAHAAAFQAPLSQMSVSQAFKGDAHRGIDLRAEVGTPGYAVADGTVLLSGPASGFGLWTVIRSEIDGQTVDFVYGHMDHLLVEAGERVTVGEHVIDTGTNGVVTGPHLHFEVWIGGRIGGHAVDPVTWLADHGAL